MTLLPPTAVAQTADDTAAPAVTGSEVSADSGQVEVFIDEASLPGTEVSGYDGSAGESATSIEVTDEAGLAVDSEFVNLASGNLTAAMEAYGKSQSLGQRAGGREGLGSGYWSLRFTQGVVVYSPAARGNVAMSSQVYERWLHKERAQWGDVKASARTAQGLVTTFTNGAYVYQSSSQLIRRADQVLNQGDILAIGDSQVWDKSWVGYGIRQAGYRDVMFRCGGVGFIAARPGVCSSYTGGVVGNEWYLPLGAPRAIYIQGSGNDIWTGQSHATIKDSARKTIQKLKQAYPGTQIILTDLFSSQIYEHRNRDALGDVLNQLAREENITSMSVKHWVTDFNARYMLEDAVHLQDRYQEAMGRNFVEPFRQALNRHTLLGGIYGFYSNTGGAARFGAPTSNETRIRDGGVYQTFSKNYTLYWSPREGTHAVWWSGAIGQAFASVGYENYSGYPLTEEEAFMHGAYQRFRQVGGQVTTYMWSPEWGAHRVWEPGAIAHKFRALGGIPALGFPRESETAYYHGVRQTFETRNGEQTRIYWSPNTGAHTMNGKGQIFNTWVAKGHAGTLGFPSSDRMTLPNGGFKQYFRAQNGPESVIVWSPRYGSKVLNARGAFYHWYVSNGGSARQGFPTTDEYRGSDGRAHLYLSNGVHLTWSEREGLRVLR